MALLTEQQCTQCGEYFFGQSMFATGNLPVCPNCQQKEYETNKAKHFAELDKLPMEERIRKIEEWIYDYKPPAIPTIGYY